VGIAPDTKALTTGRQIFAAALEYAHWTAPRLLPREGLAQWRRRLRCLKKGGTPLSSF
jgi:hypothetical protein